MEPLPKMPSRAERNSPLLRGAIGWSRWALLGIAAYLTRIKAPAGEFTWTGGSNTFWDEQDNWTDGKGKTNPPKADGKDVLIFQGILNTSTDNNGHLTVATPVRQLQFTNTNGDVAGDFTLSGSVNGSNDGTAIQLDGDDKAGDLTEIITSAATSGILTDTINLDLVFGEGTPGADGKDDPGTIIQIQAGSNHHLRINGDLSDEIPNSPADAAPVNILGTGRVEFGSGAINSYDGDTTIASGATLILNSDNSGAGGDVISNGGTLAGTGQIGGATSILGGIHSPGDMNLESGASSAGTQTFDNNLSYGSSPTVNWQLTDDTESAGFFDQIVVGGDLAFNSATTLALDFSTPGGVDWADAFWGNWTSHQWLVYDVAGTTTGFSNLSFSGPGNDGDGDAFNRNGTFFLTQSGSDIFLNYQALPEPISLGLLTIVMGYLAVTVRGRRRLRSLLTAKANSIESDH